MIVMESTMITLILYLLTSFSHGLDWYALVGKSCVTPKNYQKGIKYRILLWTFRNTVNVTFGNYLRKMSKYGNETCIYKNCLFTINKNIINLMHYDAIVYYGVTLTRMKPNDFPKRGRRQIYVFDQFESADNYPLKHEMFDDFFNWTISYKLDADIPSTYFTIYDKSGKIIGPKKKIYWKTTEKELNNDLKNKIYGKTKLVAWFVSHCKAESGRDTFVKQLQNTLQELKFNQTVDIYGRCGKLNCDRNSTKCFEMLSKDYMFYLSFENSFAQDYVTEKLKNPLQYDTVPVVYGGANYDRFAPPRSYMNACALGPRYLAIIMIFLYNNRKLYESYFKWRHLYDYDSSRSDQDHGHTKIISELLNKKRFKRSHQNFRSWWNEDSRNCRFRTPSIN